MIRLFVAACLATATLVVIWLKPVFIGFAGPVHRLITPYPDFQKLQAQGDVLVMALDKFAEEHGTYPPALKNAGVAAYSETQWGAWAYSPNGSYFQLSLGDYDWDGFVLTWNRNGGWWLNH